MDRQIPLRLMQADTLEIDFANTDIPASTYTLLLTIIALNTYTIASSIHPTDSNAYQFLETAANTANYIPADYQYSIVATDIATGLVKNTIEHGMLTIDANPTLLTNADMRTHAQKVVDSIEAVLESRASKEQLNYSIAGRSLQFISHDELLKIRAKYKREIANKKRKSKFRTVKFTL